MNITFEELREIKHLLPTGSVKKIADELSLDEQAVRNYFGANKVESEENIIDRHIQPGPDGGIVSIQNTKILKLAKKIIRDTQLQKHLVH